MGVIRYCGSGTGIGQIFFVSALYLLIHLTSICLEALESVKTLVNPNLRERLIPARISPNSLFDFDFKLRIKKVEKAEATEHQNIPQHLLQFPQELDGPRGRDVGPVEERETTPVDGEGVVGEGVICEQEHRGAQVNSLVQKQF